MVDELRRHQRLPKRERKARVFLEEGAEEDPAGAFQQLHASVREHWTWLPDDYQLRHTAVAAALGSNEEKAAGEVISSPGALMRAIKACRALGVAPTLKLTAPLQERRSPPPQLKVDPAEIMGDNPNAQMLSFYGFTRIADPAALKKELEHKLSALRVLGSIYVAEEGVNAQLMVREDELDALRETFASVRDLADIDLNVGDVVRADKTKPFHRFKVTHKRKVLQDGLAENLDLEPGRGGEELEAAQWHAELAKPEEERPLLLDCRNWYESEVGRFEGAKPLNTNKFHESWPKLEEELEGIDPNQRVLTYCTGGIRCVKVNAWLTQKLGLRNVASLKDGIVGYKRWLDEEAESAEESAKEGAAPESLFKGTNFVFDQRVGVKITDDRLTDHPELSLIYETDRGGEVPEPLRESVYHQTRIHEEEEERGGGLS